MSNTAGKLNQLIELYRKGFLCNCKSTEIVWRESDNHSYYEEEIKHEDNCSGRIKVQQMLSFPEGIE